MNQNVIFGIGILIMVGFALGMVVTAQSSAQQTLPSSVPIDDANTIVLGFKNGNYYPNTIEVKEGQPVRIRLDSSIRGCYRDFTIRSLGIRKYLPAPNDVIEFIAPAKGTYGFSCSMGMGTGTLLVN